MDKNPVGESAVPDDAERQRQRRDHLAIRRWLPTYRPWDNARCRNNRECETIHSIEEWLQYGDADAVAEWLANHLAMRPDTEKVLKAISQLIDEMEKGLVTEREEKLVE